LGKTTSTIIAALETGAKKILIICPASLKINWQREIENYTDRSVSIIEGKKWEDADFVIMNYDIIKNFHDEKDKNNSIILNSGFELVVVDEAHYIQNKQAQRTKLINDITKKLGKLWLLTGTPMTSRPINYFNLLDLVDSPVAANWMGYVRRYCEGYQFKVGKKRIWNVTGASNLEELRDRTKTHVLRRLKQDILDLPEKIITPVYLRLKSQNYEELVGEYYNWFDKQEESNSLTLQFSKLMKVRQEIASSKVKNTCELAENIIEQGKKVIIFTNFTDSLNQITEHFGKQAVKLDGSMGKPERQFSIDKFQEDDDVKVFVGNIKAAGVGITLTAGEVVIMNDLSFVPSDHSQAEDRAYRYGQKNNVLVYYPIFENTIEGIIYDILKSKKNVFETVMGDNEGRGDIVEEILNMINKRKK
jgi:SWI/SNF-related matrix-associated actin-dependent regulator of chromatin subfamily A-like protein 1